MNVKECYEKMGSDYDDALSRLMSDELIYTVCKMYLDLEDFDSMIKSLEAKDYETAFRNIHSIKGVCNNLSLTPLQGLSNDLCEELRGGEPKVDITPMVDELIEKHKMIRACIEAMEV